MDFNIDDSWLLYGLGAFLGVLAIAYFGHELILGLSPTVKSFILLSGSLIFLVAGEYVSAGILRTALYIFSSFSYLIFLTYTVLRFNLGSGQVFLVLAVSSDAFIGLGYFRGQRESLLQREDAKKLAAATAFLVFALVAFDVTGEEPDYSLELEQEVNVTEGEEFEVGSLGVENRFPLSRNIEVPDYNGCVSKGGETDLLYFRPDTRGIIGGSETRRISLTDEIRPRPDTNVSWSGIYEVVNSECPSELEDGKIYITEDENPGVLSAAGTFD